MKPSLIIKDLTFEVNKKIIFNNINISLQADNIYALIGDNGSGKTTLFKSMLGLNNSSKNNIEFNNNNLNKLSTNFMANKFSFLSQENFNLTYCLVKQRMAHGLIPMYGLSPWLSDEQINLIEQVAKDLNITHLLDRSINLISGGEQRLVNIAKTLINPQCEVFLLDEPSVFLDFKQKKILINYLLKLKSSKRIIIFSSHDSDFINKCANKILLLKNNQILQK